MMNAIYAPLLSMFFTVFCSLVAGFIIYRIYTRQDNIITDISTLKTGAEQGKTQIAATEQTVLLIRTKHYDNLAAEIAEQVHRLRLTSDRMDSLTERQTRYEAK